MKVGVISLQGAVSEHHDITKKAMKELKKDGEVVYVRRENDLEKISALIIPGGESTTISKLLIKFNLFDKIIKLAKDGLPIMGTCAGCVLLAKKGDEQVEKTNTKLLELMDMEVNRNAFGRQRESFETEVNIADIKNFNAISNSISPQISLEICSFKAVFIRAPLITKTWGKCKVISEYEGKIIGAREDNLLALSFHPELTNDLRIHKWFLEWI